MYDLRYHQGYVPRVKRSSEVFGSYIHLTINKYLKGEVENPLGFFTSIWDKVKEFLVYPEREDGELLKGIGLGILEQVPDFVKTLGEVLEVEQPYEGLLTHCLTNEAVVLFDEVNSLEGEYLFFLHEIINNKRVFIPEVNATFDLRGKVILSSNPTGRVYYGTNPLNYALLSRVVLYEVPLWEEKELKKLIKDEEIVGFFLEANKMAKEQNLSVYLGIRELLQYQALVGALGKGKALEVAFLNKVKSSADESTAEAFRGLAMSVLGI